MKFTIRDLLLVTVIVALALGWAIDHWQYSAADRDFLRRLKEKERKGGEWQSYPPRSVMEDFPNPSAPAPNPPKP